MYPPAKWPGCIDYLPESTGIVTTRVIGITYSQIYGFDKEEQLGPFTFQLRTKAYATRSFEATFELELKLSQKRFDPAPERQREIDLLRRGGFAASAVVRYPAETSVSFELEQQAFTPAQISGGEPLVLNRSSGQRRIRFIQRHRPRYTIYLELRYESLGKLAEQVEHILPHLFLPDDLPSPFVGPRDAVAAFCLALGGLNVTLYGKGDAQIKVSRTALLEVVTKNVEGLEQVAGSASGKREGREGDLDASIEAEVGAEQGETSRKRKRDERSMAPEREVKSEPAPKIRLAVSYNTLLAFSVGCTSLQIETRSPSQPTKS
ncbi:hypothetical protein JCM8547_003933 [Rhodosporidiobolus lusitaniae]